MVARSALCTQQHGGVNRGAGGGWKGGRDEEEEEVEGWMNRRAVVAAHPRSSLRIRKREGGGMGGRGIDRSCADCALGSCRFHRVVYVRVRMYS